MYTDFFIIGLTSRPSLLLLVDVILQMFEETLHTYMTYRKKSFSPCWYQVAHKKILTITQNVIKTSIKDLG